MNNTYRKGYMLGYMEKEAGFGYELYNDLMNRAKGTVRQEAKTSVKAGIKDLLGSNLATVGAAGLGGVAGTMIGGALGGSYAGDQGLRSTPGMVYGGMMGGGLGALTGLAAMALINKYRNKLL